MGSNLMSKLAKDAGKIAGKVAKNVTKETATDVWSSTRTAATKLAAGAKEFATGAKDAFNDEVNDKGGEQ